MFRIITEYNSPSGNEEKFLSDLINFSFYLNDFNLGFKKDRNVDDYHLNFIIEELRKIPSIKNKEILYNQKFVNNFYRIFWELISKLGVATQNFYIFIDRIVDEMNRITLPEYVISDCHSTDLYNCGRAMIILNDNPKNKILVFNSDDKGFMDLNTQKMYLECGSKNNSPISSSTSSKNNSPNSSKNNSPNSSPRELDILNLDKIYGKMAKRIEKEINMLKKSFEVKIIEQLKGIKLILVGYTPEVATSSKSFISPKILITFNLPLEYPYKAPSGTFKDLTISEVDIDWSVDKKLKDIVDKLLYKNKNKLFPKHKEILCYLYLLDM